MDKLHGEIILELFPGLFELINDELMFNDINISTGRYECIIILINSCLVYNIQAIDNNMDSVFIRFTELEPGVRGTTNMTLPRGESLSEESLVRLFELDIDVRHSFDPWGEGDDIYRTYDRHAIMRRHTIKNIIEDER